MSDIEPHLEWMIRQRDDTIARLTKRLEAAEKVIAALDDCESNRGRFSCCDAHDCRCPASSETHTDYPKCVCGADDLAKALAAYDAAKETP